MFHLITVQHHLQMHTSVLKLHLHINWRCEHMMIASAIVFQLYHTVQIPTPFWQPPPDRFIACHSLLWSPPSRCKLWWQTVISHVKLYRESQVGHTLMTDILHYHPIKRICHQCCRDENAKMKKQGVVDHFIGKVAKLTNLQSLAALEVVVRDGPCFNLMTV